MVNPEPQELLDALQAALRPHLERSEPLRVLARLLGQFLIDEARRSEQAATSRITEVLTPTVVPVVGPITPVRTGPAALVPLKIGDTTVHVPVQGTTSEIGRARAAAAQIADDDAFSQATSDHSLNLSLIEQRCRLKAESCRLYIERRSAEGDPMREPLVLERMRDMIARGKALPTCFLWVFWREETQPDDNTLMTIASCYEALASAASLAHKLDERGERTDPADLANVFQLLAEANSALRVSLEATWLRRPDIDQDDAHLWLRRETANRRILVSRFMRLDDPADPARAPELISEVRDLEARIMGRLDHSKKIAGFLQKVRYHGDLLVREADQPNPHHARQIETAVESLTPLGVPPHDSRVTSLLTPGILAAWPSDHVPAETLSAAIAAARNAHTTSDDEDSPPSRSWSPRVAQARALIDRRGMVIVGGEPRTEAIVRLADAFEIDESEITWVHLGEHSSAAPLRAPIMHPRTCLVLVLIKLTGHQHAEEANRYAREAGKPCVYLKAGYNPEQVAEAIMTQAAEQLTEAI